MQQGSPSGMLHSMPSPTPVLSPAPVLTPSSISGSMGSGEFDGTPTSAQGIAYRPQPLVHDWAFDNPCYAWESENVWEFGNTWVFETAWMFGCK